MTRLDSIKSLLRQQHNDLPRRRSLGEVELKMAIVAVFAAVLYGILMGGLR